MEETLKKYYDEVVNKGNCIGIGFYDLDDLEKIEISKMFGFAAFRFKEAWKDMITNLNRLKKNRKTKKIIWRN